MTRGATTPDEPRRETGALNRAHTALRESEELFHLLVERVQDYAIFLIDADGRVATWNLGAERIKGYAASEIVGRPYATFFTPEDREAGKPDRLLRRARQEGRVEDEGWRVRSDGSLFWADAVLTGLFDDEGRLRGYAKVTRDMTERRRLEAELAARQAAEIAVQLRDEFLSVAAHELKTPVTGVRAMAELALRRITRAGGTMDPEQVRVALERIVGQSTRLGRLIERLLDLSRIQAGQLQVEPGRIDLARLVEDTVATAAVAWPEHSFEVHAPEALWVEGDALRLEQVLANLLDNAAKYGAPGGTVGVELAVVGDEARLAVRDRGEGVPEAERTRLFDPFFQGHNASHQSGMGLGLYVSKQIVELHGGRLWAEFPEDGGTRMVVGLPYASVGSAAA